MIYHEMWLTTHRVRTGCHIEGQSLGSTYDALYHTEVDQYYANYTQEPTDLPGWLLTSKKVGLRLNRIYGSL